MKHIIIILAIFLTAIIVHAKPYNILIIHSYQQEFPETKLQHNGFVKGLRSSDSKDRYNIFTEYLNAKTSYAGLENTEVIDNYMLAKYLMNKPDLIYATNDEALSYLSSTSLGFLREVPLIVTGISDSPAIYRSGTTYGILINHNITKTIEIINTLLNSTPDITFIDSENGSSKKTENYVSTLSNNKQQILFKTEKNIDKLLTELKGGKDSAFVIVNAGGFYSGNRHETTASSLRKLKESLPSPYIFAMHKLEIQEGVLGGFVTSELKQGEEAGIAARQTLQGNPPQKSHIYTGNHLIFDRKAVDRAFLRIPEPLNSQITFINNYPTFLEKHGQLLIWITVLLALTTLITLTAFSIHSTSQRKQLTATTKKLAEASRKNKQYMDAVDASNFVSIADQKGRVKYISNTYLSAIGYSSDEVIGQKHHMLNHPEMDVKRYKTLIKTVSSGRIWVGILLNKTKNGDTLYLETSVVPIQNEDGVITEYLSVRKDITKVIMQQREIQSQYQDVLTGLPNRVKMRLDRNRATLPAVALMNIDGFSAINTYYGMEGGDYLLKSVAGKLAALIPDRMSVYRVSGDEFGILCYDVTDYDAFNSVIQDILNKISKSTFIYKETEMHFSLTAGTASGMETTITKAGIALRQAKKNKKSFMTYDEAESEMEKIRETVKYSGSLRDALSHEKIIPYFQPIVDTATGEIIKYEALMRIENEKGDIMTPNMFLSMSKSLKLYNSLSLMMLEKSLNSLSDTVNDICINFDMEDIRNNKFQTYFFDIISQKNLQGRITVEITESEGIDNMDELSVFIARAKKHGCLIALDDFGTGYSNFMYILSLQPDFLKIDGSITRQINVSGRARLLTSTIVEMCRQAGIKTVAEYVSTDEIYSTIKEVGVDYCQGYLFGKPAPNFIKSI
ncbi:EAL domain-containing protein [Deferribacteres bacterium DY0037]